MLLTRPVLNSRLLLLLLRQPLLLLPLLLPLPSLLLIIGIPLHEAINNVLLSSWRGVRDLVGRP